MPLCNIVKTMPLLKCCKNYTSVVILQTSFPRYDGFFQFPSLIFKKKNGQTLKISIESNTVVHDSNYWFKITVIFFYNSDCNGIHAIF